MPTLHVYITDIDERHAPPSDPVLQVSVVAETVFLTIGKFEETNKSSTFTKQSAIAVDAITLLHQLFTLIPDWKRHSDLVDARNRNPLA